MVYYCFFGDKDKQIFSLQCFCSIFFAARCPISCFVPEKEQRLTAGYPGQPLCFCPDGDGYQGKSSMVLSLISMLPFLQFSKVTFS